MLSCDKHIAQLVLDTIPLIRISSSNWVKFERRTWQKHEQSPNKEPVKIHQIGQSVSFSTLIAPIYGIQFVYEKFRLVFFILEKRKS